MVSLLGGGGFFGVMGYESGRAIDLSGKVDDFISQFRARNENTQAGQAFCEDVRSVRLLFQVTGEEIGRGAEEAL